MKKSVILALMSGLSFSVPAFADWNIETPGQYSAAGAMSVGTGVLQTIAAPIDVSGNILDNQGLATASSNGLHRAGEGLQMAGLGVVLLLEGAGKGLSELGKDSILAGSTLVGATVDAVNESIPRATVQVNGQRKTIPLVVRPGCYVEMHQKLEVTP